MGVRLDALEPAAGPQRLDQGWVGILHELSGDARDGLVEAGLGVHRVQDRQAGRDPDLTVDLAERGREVHDARAVVDGHELGRNDSERATGRLVETFGREPVERALVVRAHEIGDGDGADDLRVVAEQRRHPRRGQHDVAPARLDPDVLDVGSDRGPDVGDEGPRCGGPDEQVEVGIDHGEADVHGVFGDVAVRAGLAELVARERGATPTAVRHDLVALVDHVLVPERAELPPHALDELVAHGPVRV